MAVGPNGIGQNGMIAQSGFGPKWHIGPNSSELDLVY